MNRELLKKNFENHGFQTSFFDTADEATEYLLSEIKDCTVGHGGSMTLSGMDLYNKLAEHNEVFDYKERGGAKKSLTSNVFITSANGISETGEIINIDGTGNRIAASCYGHKKVYFVVGRNKIAPTMMDAWQRAKDIASPLNCVRLDKKTPCAVKKDKCYDCNSPERICCATLIIERCMHHMEMEVVFIDEDMGF